jgi:molybdopterin converting factor small subunit
MIKLILIVLLGIFYVGFMQQPGPSATVAHATHTAATQGNADQVIADAFEHQQGNIQVEGQGTVLKVLKDDREGLQHQRFILRLANGHSLLIAHNTELAGRVENLKAGDTVAFYGEYEWNPKGGVLHWTHHDPHHHHINGWLKHNGITYQ